MISSDKELMHIFRYAAQFDHLNGLFLTEQSVTLDFETALPSSALIMVQNNIAPTLSENDFSF